MRPNISGWGNVQLSVGWSVRLPIGWLVCQSIRLSVTYSLNSSKFDILPIFTKRNWTSKINGVHIRPNNCYSTTWQPQYHSDHNKTTKKRRRIFVRQNLFFYLLFHNKTNAETQRRQLTSLTSLPVRPCLYEFRERHYPHLRPIDRLIGPKM